MRDNMAGMSTGVGGVGEVGADAPPLERRSPVAARCPGRGGGPKSARRGVDVAALYDRLAAFDGGIEGVAGAGVGAGDTEAQRGQGLPTDLCFDALMSGAAAGDIEAVGIAQDDILLALRD